MHVAAEKATQPAMERIEANMSIEELPPNAPDWKLIGTLIIVSLLAILVLALVFIGFGGKHILPHSLGHRVTSQLVLPGTTTTPLA